MAAFPDPASRPFAALGVDVQLFVGIPYPQHALSPGLVLAGDQWAMDRLQNGAAVHKDSGHSSNDQAGPSPDTKGAREGLLKREFHQPDCGHRTINSSGGGAVLTRFGFVFEHAVFYEVVGVVVLFMAPVEISVTRLPPSTRSNLRSIQQERL